MIERRLLAVALLASCLVACSVRGEWSSGSPPAVAAPPPRDAGPSTPAPSPSAAAIPVPDAGFDAGPPPPTRVPMFIAQGKLGRRTVSCDDGRTWIADHSEVPDARCWDDTAAVNIECDHHEWSSVGMVDADGYFLATFGWGYPGMVRRTEDGIHWDDVLPGHTFAGLAFGNGHVVANDHAPWTSASAGAVGSWAKAGDVASDVWNVRRIGFVPDGGGRFIISLQSATTDIVWSDDNAQTWHQATGRPAECGNQVIGIVDNGVATLMAQANGTVCRSTDRGDHWTHVPVTTSFSSNVLVVDGKFTLWTGATRFQSEDGAVWTSAEGTAGVSIGAVARGASGTFVAVRGGWQAWYEKQAFYRSSDGVNWETLPTTAFSQGHPITHVAFGMVKPSAECPL